MERIKVFTVALAMVLLSVFCWMTTASARTNLQSTYRLWTVSQVEVLPVNGYTTESYVVVVDSNWARVTTPVCVNFIWQEAWSKELINFGQVQKACSDGNGDVYFPVPASSVSFFRYLTMWVDEDLSSMAHRLFWYTADTTMPARINLVSGSSALSLGETGSYLFQVLNAWGNPLPNVRVKIIRGECYASPEVGLTNESGYVTFSFTAPSGAVGSEHLRVEVDPWRFLQSGLTITWSGGGVDPIDPVGKVASILAVNATTYDGSLPVFDLDIEESYSAVFVAKDSSGNPVAGASLTSVFPSATGTTGADGKVSFALTGADSAGSDMGQIYVTSNSGIYLDFRIVTSGLKPDPDPVGKVASISAVNAMTYDGTLPVFDLAIGQSYSAVFIAKDSSGNPVAGVSLNCLYPTATVITDSNGQVTITLPASQYEGWDSSQIYVVTSYPTVYLDFKITYN